MALIEFQNNTAPYLNAQNLNNNFNYLEQKTQDMYSTNETIIGKWKDGKPIYRKVYINTYTTASKVDVVLQNDVDTLINAYGLYDVQYSTNPRINIGNPFLSASGTPDAYASINYVTSTNNVQVRFGVTQSAYQGLTGCYSIILEYTKVTDEGDE